MTLFEYLSVALSIVVSLGAAQPLGGLRGALRPEGRYWVHVAWIGALLFGHLLIWWEFWGYRHVEDWTLGGFILMLVNPGLYYVAASALIEVNEDEGRGREARFHELKGSFCLPFGLVIPISMLRDWLILGIPMTFPKSLPEMLVAVVALVAWSTSNRRVHAGLAALISFVLLGGVALVWLRPGGASAG